MNPTGPINEAQSHKTKNESYRKLKIKKKKKKDLATL